jgi:hypothetical protein
MPTKRPSLEGLRNIGNWTQTFRWWVDIEEPPPAVTVDSEAINFRAESIEIPKANPMSTEIIIRGHKKKQIGIVDYTNTIALTCVETVDNVVSQFVRDWREACWQTDNGSTGISHSQKDVEARIKIMRLDNRDNPIWQYILYGCFLETFEPGGPLDGATPEPLKPAITVSFDYFNDGPVK